MSDNEFSACGKMCEPTAVKTNTLIEHLNYTFFKEGVCRMDDSGASVKTVITMTQEDLTTVCLQILNYHSNLSAFLKTSQWTDNMYQMMSCIYSPIHMRRW